MDARGYLLEYAALKMEVINNEERIVEAFNDTQIPYVHLSDGSRRPPVSKSRQENANIRYIELKERLQPQIEANKAKMWEIEDNINRLKDPQSREVLRMRYIDVNDWDPTPWWLVAKRLYGAYDEKELKRVQRIHKKALDSFTEVLEIKQAGE